MDAEELRRRAVELETTSAGYRTLANELRRAGEPVSTILSTPRHDHVPSTWDSQTARRRREQLDTAVLDLRAAEDEIDDWAHRVDSRAATLAEQARDLRTAATHADEVGG